MADPAYTVRKSSWAVLRVMLILGVLSCSLSGHAVYLARSYIITATAGEGGSISPSGAVKVSRGKDQTFKITPDHGFEILDVLVDGNSVGPVSEYKFNNVNAPHTIHATFRASLAVLQVTIPNVSMKIGDVVPVTITVTDDDGTPYTLVSGAVGGYLLERFQRISATAYQTYFIIIQGGESFAAEENIPVAGLVISNGEAQSAPYELPVIQDRDPLDAALPLISSMAVAGGVKKIGDVVVLNIYADGENYSADPHTTIHGYALTASNVTFSESGGGYYVLSYTVQEGDPDIVPGSSGIEVSVVLIRPSGNVGLPYSKVDNASQLVVDANAPVVSRMEVRTQEPAVGVGGTVRVEIMADGLDYTAAAGTVINGVPVDSTRVTFSGLADGLYEISYEVAATDAPVAPGMLQLGVVPVDPAGNIGKIYSDLSPNNLEIYTDRPVVVIQGDADICKGEASVLGVYLSGRAPWRFDLFDGVSTTSYKDIASSALNIDIAPVVTTTYQIRALTDVNGVVNPEPKEFRVTVNEKTEVEIINLALGYSVDADPVRLEADVPGGVFSGPGVNSATGYFYPVVADTVNSPHTIYYNYINEKGCSSSDSSIVYVAGSLGAILIPGKTVCLNDDPFMVRVFNLSGAIGSFSLLDPFSNPVPGLTDNLDNTATIDPARLSLESYTIEFRYMDAGTHYLTETFSVETVSQPEILNLNEGSYCQSAAPIVLQSNLENVLFEGPGVSGNTKDGFIFNPAATEPGDVTIICTAYSQNGCTESIGKSVTIVAAPGVKFTMSITCPEEGGVMGSFENQSAGISLVKTWNWDFGDPASGQDNFSMLIHPTHLYQEPGPKSITLVATTLDGCVGTFVMDSVIVGKPQADFAWISDCFSGGPGVKFVNTSMNTSDSPDEITWTFKTGNGDVLGEIGSDSPGDTVAFLFNEAGTYRVDLMMMNKGGCSDEITKEIVIRPTIQLDSEGYWESFDVSEGLWTIQSENQVESWVWDVPDFTGFVPLEGDRAWFTRLPAGVAGYYENSWIQSPCFDFSDMDRPLIRMDIMRSFVPGMNGAVLQFQDVIQEGWKTVGEQIPGIGWYNSFNIYNRPGGSSTGWGLEVFHPDKEWVTAAHDLDQVAGKPGVAFRVAFASNGELEMKNQGFALNNVIIAERSKLAVLEHFTDNSLDNARKADDIIDGVATAHPQDVIDLQYHTNTSGMDIMNLNNPFPPSTRSFNYGVPRVPYSVLDGGVSVQHKFDFSNLETVAVEDQLRLLTLEIPAFEIDLTVDWLESGLEAHTTVTCLNEGYGEYIQLYLVVFETSVTAYSGSNGDTQFRNVVLDMLPTQGKLLGGNWYEGKSEMSTDNWTYQPYVEDIDDLAVAAFVQDRSTFRILQAAVNFKDKTVGTLDALPAIYGLRISPNPAEDLLHVNLGTRTERPGSIVVLDMSGKVLLAEQVPAGYQLFQLDIGQLERGMYILRWIESGQVRGVSKVVKAR
ncbi:MAG: T9SS type A sorting domain-containing protein [Bacteroidota bacterium]